MKDATLLARIKETMDRDAGIAQRLIPYAARLRWLRDDIQAILDQAEEQERVRRDP